MVDTNEQRPTKVYFTVHYDENGEVVGVERNGKPVPRKKIKVMNLGKVDAVTSPAVIISKPGGSPCCVGSGGWGWCWC
jgi:hypothetical protein